MLIVSDKHEKTTACTVDVHILGAEKPSLNAEECGSAAPSEAADLLFRPGGNVRRFRMSHRV